MLFAIPLHGQTMFGTLSIANLSGLTMKIPAKVGGVTRDCRGDFLP